MCFRFQRFRSKLEMQVKYQELNAIVEADSAQTTSGLAAGFDVSVATIIVHLRQIS